MEAKGYLAWKCEQVIAALASRGLYAPVEEVRPVPLASRRRAAFTLGRTARGVVFGYRGARSQDIVDIEVCPVLSPAIAGRLPKLKSALAPLLGDKSEARVTATEADQGLDLVIDAWQICSQAAAPSPSPSPEASLMPSNRMRRPSQHLAKRRGLRRS